MSKLVGIKGGVSVNRVLLCMNAYCSGVEQTPQGPAPVRMAQIQYSHIPAPACPFCGIQMHIDSMHAKNSAHVSKRDQHRLKDKILADTFTTAEKHNHKLVEGGREGDVGKVVIPASTQQYMAETAAMAKNVNLHTGFGAAGANMQQKMRNVQAIAAGAAHMAQETRAQGALMPMDALAAAQGNHKFWQVPKPKARPSS